MEAAGLRRQLRLVVAGLMGSGKSTLCRMLRHLLGGAWVNQDEFSHCGKGAKRAFLAEVKRLASDRAVPALIVDKINTLRQHRRDILEAMQSGLAGDVVFIQMRHPCDAPDCWDEAVRLCESRIRERGEGHRTLKGDDPKLKNILRMTVSGIEPMLEDELTRFAAHLTVDMTLDPIASTLHVLSDLDEAELLSRFDVEELQSEQSVMDAMQASMEAEVVLRSASGGTPASKQKVKLPKLWMWTIDLDADSRTQLWQLWGAYEPQAPREFQRVEDLHVTLLYLGGGSDAEVASRHPQLGGAEAVARLREDLQNREGMEVRFEAGGVAWDDRLAALEVGGLDSLSANPAPHVTLARRPAVRPRTSNELLARKAASGDLQAGLAPWLHELGLAQYEGPLLEWCLAMGAATPDEIAENAADAAAAVERRSEEERRRVEEVFARSAPGELRTEALSKPLCLSGRIVGRLRGQPSAQSSPHSRSTSP